MKRGWAVETRGDYPQAWKDGLIQQIMYAWSGYTCEHCGMAFEHGTTIAKSARRKDGKPFILTVHHLDGDKSNCHVSNLLACCQRCHLQIQATWEPSSVIPWGYVPQWLILRGIDYQLPAFSQLKMF